MAKKATKAADNVFYKARMEAADTNDMLNSREGASEATGIDRTRLARIELGTLAPYPEEVLLLSDTYNTPEIGNHFCSHMCPLGKNYVLPVEVAQLDRLTLKIVTSLKTVVNIKEALLDIAEDGVISIDEKPKFIEIINTLDNISKSAQSLKLWAEKNLK
jgi:hypothetical protein